MTNQVIIQMARELKKAAIKNDAPLWSKLSQYALKPSVARKSINLYKINQLTKENDVVIFPGKVLGTGNMLHKITLYSFSISDSAASKIIQSGGKLASHTDIIKDKPTGKGVVLLG